MTKNVLITGGAGFIGSHTADFLLEQGLSVTVLDDLSTGKAANLNLSSPLLRFVEGSILDAPLLAKLLRDCDAVLHLAAVASVQESVENPLHTHAVNAIGFVQVLQTIREARRPLRLVYASSASVYGDPQILPCTDETPLLAQPLSPYALQKIQDEQYAALYARLFKLNSLGLRYFNVYGSRQDPNSAYSGVISRFIADYKQNKTLTIYGDGQQSRDFIHVSDVARANWLALQKDYQGVLNIATGSAETLNHLISYLEEIGGTKAPFKHTAARLGDIRASYATTQQARQRLDFAATVNLRLGMEELFNSKEVSYAQ